MAEPSRLLLMLRTPGAAPHTPTLQTLGQVRRQGCQPGNKTDICSHTGAGWLVWPGEEGAPGHLASPGSMSVSFHHQDSVEGGYYLKALLSPQNEPWVKLSLQQGQGQILEQWDRLASNARHCVSINFLYEDLCSMGIKTLPFYYINRKMVHISYS